MHIKLIASVFVWLFSLLVMQGCLDVQKKRQVARDQLKRDVATIMGNEKFYMGNRVEGFLDSDNMRRDENDPEHLVEFIFGKMNDTSDDKISGFIRMTREIGSDTIASAIFIKIMGW